MADALNGVKVIGNLMYAGSLKGSKIWNEDACFTWQSPDGRVTVGGVFDGHSGYDGLLAANASKSYALHWFSGLTPWHLATWTNRDWEVYLRTMFTEIHDAIRSKFMSESATTRRYIDKKVRHKITHLSGVCGGGGGGWGESKITQGIVRYPDGEPVRGGTTATIVIAIKQDDGSTNVICSNVGDSVPHSHSHSRPLR